MTSEAALAKLSYVLGQPGLSLDGRKEVHTPGLRAQAPRAVGVGARVTGLPGAWRGSDLGRWWGPAQWVCPWVEKGAEIRGLLTGGAGLALRPGLPLPLLTPSSDSPLFHCLGVLWSGTGQGPSDCS